MLPLPDLEPRLQARYHRLVVAQLPDRQRLAAGLHAVTGSAAAAAQGAWRFFANPDLDLPDLVTPLHAEARAAVATACQDYVLVVYDWSLLHYGGHPSKPDRVALAHQRDLGYELLTALAVGDRDGSPLAPLALELRAQDGVHSTRHAGVRPAGSALDELAPILAEVAALNLGKPVVSLIDREADSVGHLRDWAAASRFFVVRADAQPRANWQGVHQPLGRIADQLVAGGALHEVGPVDLAGRPARQFVAETGVTLTRPARRHRVDLRTGQARHQNVPGPPLRLRLIVSVVRDAQGRELARWLLLTNLPPTVAATTVARWYYWRWRIESYHKLLKGAGQQLEQWQQESAAALARRLVVTAMAAVVVWRLARDPRPEAGALRAVLVRLSGRQIKRTRTARPFTEPALLAGLGVLLPMLDLLETYTPAQLRRLAQAVLPALNPTGLPRNTG